MRQERKQRTTRNKEERENEMSQEKFNEKINEAFVRMKHIRSFLGTAGFEVGKAMKMCESVVGSEGFQKNLAEVGAKIAYLLGDCIVFCDKHQERIDAERAAKIAEIKKMKEKEKEDEANKEKEKPLVAESDEREKAKIMAPVFDGAKKAVKKGRKPKQG